MTSPVPSSDSLIELLAVAREQLRWQQAASIPAVKRSLVDVLETTQMRRAYELCDGSRTFREIAAAVGVSLSTIASWTRRWREAGLAYEDGAGRLRHLVGLDALGVPVEAHDESKAGRSRN
jgi:transposase-like protein